MNAMAATGCISIPTQNEFHLELHFSALFEKNAELLKPFISRKKKLLPKLRSYFQMPIDKRDECLEYRRRQAKKKERKKTNSNNNNNRHIE